MSKKNFNRIMNAPVPEQWIENALHIPEQQKKKKAPVLFLRSSRLIAAAASLILVSALSVALYLFIGDHQPLVAPPVTTASTAAADETQPYSAAPATEGGTAAQSEAADSTTSPPGATQDNTPSGLVGRLQQELRRISGSQPAPTVAPTQKPSASRPTVSPERPTVPSVRPTVPAGPTVPSVKPTVPYERPTVPTERPTVPTEPPTERPTVPTKPTEYEEEPWVEPTEDSTMEPTEETYDWPVPTEEPHEPPTASPFEPTETTERSDFYLVGSMSGWLPQERYRLHHDYVSSDDVYMIENVYLDENSQFKIVLSGDGKNPQIYFPDGMGNNYGENAEITQPGRYTIYFRPYSDGGNGWFYGCIFVRRM